MYENLLQLIGNTPLLSVNNMLLGTGVELLAKLEAQNPGGSVKDRVALSMIEAAESSGELTRDKTVIEATSGNTGIGLAMVCAAKGYNLKLIMPESASEERKRILSAYGADLHLTPGHLSTDGAIEEAYRLAREEAEHYVLMDQFNNPASIEAHYLGTGKEIWEQTQGTLTHVVCTLGTSGTAMGVAKRMREWNPEVRIVAVEPYIGHKIQGLKNMQDSYSPGIYNRNALDRIIHIEDERAFSLCREMAKQEGLFVGMSSGAALGGALQVASEIDQGRIVVIFPDSGERYLSTSLFVSPAIQGLSLYNIKSREQEVLQLQNANMSIFTPGPSADEPGELQAWRRMTFMDVLTRYLKNKDACCSSYVGIADLDDQSLHMARESNLSSQEFARQFREDLEKTSALLGIDDVKFRSPRPQQKVMLDMCRSLLNKGRAYEKLRSVYYDIYRDSEYGKLVGTDIDKLSLGKTVDLESYAKDHPQDFTLLKRASLKDLKKGDFFKTEWGNVRPSWYLQMAASVVDELNQLQVVMAGREHRFPHLDNLRAIWNKTRQVDPQIWTVVQNVDSDRNEESVPDITSLMGEVENCYVIRMWLLSISYRKPLFYSLDNLKMWENNWKRIQHLVSNLYMIPGEEGDVSGEVKQANFDLRSGFVESFEDDMSVYRFWPILFDFCKLINRRFTQKRLNGAEAAAIKEKLRLVDDVLRIIDWEKIPMAWNDLPDKVLGLVTERYTAKKEKDYQKADSLREEIAGEGYQVEDTPYGTKVMKRKILEF
ncbi:MAG: cysteine synthase [Thermodesulfobacteriota bacterium]